MMLSCKICMRCASIPLLASRITSHSALGQNLRSVRRIGTASTPAFIGRDTFIDSYSPRRDPQTPSDPVYDKKKQQKLRFAVTKHLEHLHDPYTIAQHVERTLRAGGDPRFDETLLLVQTASKEYPCTVAWNYLIDHQLKMHRLRPAIRLFNEMKKRAQKPNSHTYTTILRGCGQNPHKTAAVSEAVRLFDGMAKDSNVQPNIIHANAVLRACAVAGDLDAMFAFLDKVQEETKLRADSITYATILQGLRHSLTDEEGAAGLPVAVDKKARTNQVITQCGEIWNEIISRAQKLEFNIDEMLICAMGRVYLSGDTQQKKKVFALLEETMGLPRLDESAAPPPTPAVKFRAAKPGKLRHSPPNSSHPLVRPGTNTLSLILQTSTELRHVQVGRRYWKYLVDEKGVVPDHDLWHNLLRLTHASGSSSEAARILEAMPPQSIRQNTVRTALLTCLRNGHNINAFAHARTILDIQLELFGNTKPDVKSLWTFLQVAHRCASAGTNSGGRPPQAFCDQAAGAMEAIWPNYARAVKAVGLDRIVNEHQLPFESDKRMREVTQVIDLARDMVSLTSKIVGGVDRRRRDALSDMSSDMNRQVVAFTTMHDAKKRAKRQEVDAAESD